MGITVHDINSTKISIESLTFQGNKYTAVVECRAQDHFGLDSASADSKYGGAFYGSTNISAAAEPEKASENHIVDTVQPPPAMR